MSSDNNRQENTHISETDLTIVQVAVPLPIRQKTPIIYDYLVPAEMTVTTRMIVQVPLGKRPVWGIVIHDAPSGDVNHAKLKPILQTAALPALSEAHLRFLHMVADWTMAPFGMVMRMMLSCPKAHLLPKSVTLYGLPNDKPEGEPDNMTDRQEASLTPKRQRVISFLESNPAMTAPLLAQETSVSQAVIKTMAQKGLLATSLWHQEEDLSYKNLPPSTLVDLTTPQQEIADGIAAHLDNGFSAHLLDGVTGSGKTEVYFELVAQAMSQQKQILILLPEIALTTAWQARFESRFGMKPHIWHSSVAESKRRSLWRASAKGEAVVVVGARSALFLPFVNLGLVIVDEEHEQAFKQEDMVIYQARDMAVMRAHIENIPIILATATPSLESWVNAGQGPEEIQARYHHWRLADRVGDAQLPEITMIDLKKDRPPAGRWLSDPLIKAIEDTLHKEQQSLLFLNRRGYAPLAICESCGTKAKCHHCDSWLVTHRLSGSRQCHHCGYRQRLRDECDECGTQGQMRAYGPGVERLAEEVGTLFPEARYCIFSSDTAARPEVAKEMIRAIEDGEVDIIIGTQMAAKGHHFPHLTLVGVVDADFGLQGGDLRAAERTYQMLSQAAGRAGRESAKGSAYLQSYDPENAVFKALCAGDRDAFLDLEIQMRHAAHMPPFGRLAAVILSGVNEADVEEAAVALSAMRPQYKDVHIFGPTPAPIARLRGRYRIRFLIQAPRQVNLQQILRDWIERQKISSQIYLQIDIDPYSFL